MADILQMAAREDAFRMMNFHIPKVTSRPVKYKITIFEICPISDLEISHVNHTHHLHMICKIGTNLKFIS